MLTASLSSFRMGPNDPASPFHFLRYLRSFPLFISEVIHGLKSLTQFLGPIVFLSCVCPLQSPLDGIFLSVCSSAPCNDSPADVDAGGQFHDTPTMNLITAPPPFLAHARWRFPLFFVFFFLFLQLSSLSLLLFLSLSTIFLLVSSCQWLDFFPTHALFLPLPQPFFAYLCRPMRSFL